MTADVFTQEIIKDGLIAASDEGFVTLVRTSKSPIIYEIADCACAITDKNGDMAAEATSHPGFLNLLPFAVKDAIRKFGLERLYDGDIVVTNDPYVKGNHLPDVGMVMPIFYNERVVAFSTNMAHWTEIGGSHPGSIAPEATEIYQEGLLFPTVKLFEEGKINESLEDVIRSGVRLPDMTLGDMHAQVASLRVTTKRFQELCVKYGLETVLGTIDAYMQAGEEIAKRELKKLPKGTFKAEDYVDDDNLTATPIPVRAKVTITNDEFIVDYTGSGPQAKSSINSTYATTMSNARIVYKAILDPHAPTYEGYFKPLKLIAPEGCIFNAKRPAATSTFWQTVCFSGELIWKALAPHMPERLPAGHYTDVCATIFSGKDPRTNRFFVMIESQDGGWGAGTNKDGESGLIASGDGDTFNVPVEVCETRYPLLVEKYAFSDLDEGGAGKFRGGFGIIREYRVLGTQTEFTALFGRSRFPVWGLLGGQDGTTNYVQVVQKRNGKTTTSGKFTRLPLVKGDLVRLVTANGGGYGRAMDRAPELVLNDFLNEFITSEQAARLYGVVIDKRPGRIEGRRIRRDRKQKRS